jgi:uncharacterized protein (DUF2062 family)
LLIFHSRIAWQCNNTECCDRELKRDNDTEARSCARAQGSSRNCSYGLLPPQTVALKHRAVDKFSLRKAGFEVMKTERGAAAIRSLMRSFAWPRRGFGRVFRYVILRLTRLKVTPHSAALGFAAGAAISCTPLLGLHFVIALAIAFLTGGSMIAAMLGTAFGNPLTFPLLFAASYWIGDRAFELIDAVGGGNAVLVHQADAQSMEEAGAAADRMLDATDAGMHQGWLWKEFDTVWPVFSKMLVGSVPLFIATYVIFYFVVRAAVSRFMEARSRRMAASGLGGE